MLYLTITNGLAVLVVAGLVVALLIDRKQASELVAHLEAQHQAERARFLAAVQRPDVVQPPSALKRRAPEEVRRQYEQAQNFAAVGTVQHTKGD